MSCVQETALVRGWCVVAPEVVFQKELVYGITSAGSGTQTSWLVSGESGRVLRRNHAHGDPLGATYDGALSLLSRTTGPPLWQKRAGTGFAIQQAGPQADPERG